MTAPDRRHFFGLAAALAAGPTLIRTARAQDADDWKPDTLFLTWQRDPTTTMTVQWVGGEYAADDPTDVPIHVCRLGDTKWTETPTKSRPFPMTDRKAYRSELTGLQPGTEYQFRIGNANPIHRFRTMPAKATNEFTFVSGGDCGVNPHALANNYMAAKQDPYFALIGGDLGYDNGRLPGIAVGLRNYAKAMIDSLGRLIPMVVCIGNHEVFGGYNKPRANAPFFLTLFDGLFKETTYATLDFGDYLSLVLLDTGHVSKITGEQTDWLDKALAARLDRPHLIAVNHVPAYPSYRADTSTTPGRTGTGEDQRKHWVPLFEQHNVDLVLEHHDHTFKRTHPLKDGTPDKNGILYLGDGSWGRLRVPKAPEKRPYLAASSRSYHLTVHRLEGEQRFHMAVEETGKIVDVCMTGKKPRSRQSAVE